MGDMGEIFNAAKEQSKKKREANRNSSAMILTEKGIGFESKNNGAHLVIIHNENYVDFWPGTGLFIFRKTGIKGRGVNNLIKKIL